MSTGLPARARPRPVGLTLVEVLVALVILMAVLLPVIAAFTQALVATNQSAISCAATAVAVDKMEELKQMDYSAVQSQARQPRPFGNRPGFFEVEVNVTTERDDPVAGLKRVVVSVYRAGSQSPVVTLASYFAVRGL